MTIFDWDLFFLVVWWIFYYFWLFIYLLPMSVWHAVLTDLIVNGMFGINFYGIKSYLIKWLGVIQWNRNPIISDSWNFLISKRKLLIENVLFCVIYGSRKLICAFFIILRNPKFTREFKEKLIIFWLENRALPNIIIVIWAYYLLKIHLFSSMNFEFRFHDRRSSKLNWTIAFEPSYLIKSRRNI